MFFTKRKIGIFSLLILSFLGAGFLLGAIDLTNTSRPDPLAEQKSNGANFQVGEFTGAFTYDYPVSLPMGRAGMVPNLSLLFNSQDVSRQNQFGFHWSVPMYKIERLNTHGIENLYNRNDFIAITPFESGELVAINASPYGAYGQKVDQTFASYTFNADNTWTVVSKSGITYQFGQTNESRQFDQEDQSKVFAWHLEAITDASGNTIHYTYAKHDNTLYPKEIFYGGNSIESAPFNIKFLPFANNETGPKRSDGHWGFERGFLAETNYLVSEIEVYENNQLIHNYSFNYWNAPNLARKTVSSIGHEAYVGGEYIRLPDTEFDYSESLVRWQQSELYTDIPFLLGKTEGNRSTNSYNEMNHVNWQMDADGVEDFEYYKRTEYRDPTYGTDSIGDIAYRTSPRPDGTWEVATYENRRFGEYVAKGSNPTQPPTHNQSLIDINGDMLLDLITSYKDGSTDISSVKINNPDGPDEVVSDSYLLPLAANLYSYGVSIGDVNGDGLPDMTVAISEPKPDNWNDSVPYTRPTMYYKTCINNGQNGCDLQESDNRSNSFLAWQLPAPSINERGHRRIYLQDCNYDGLVDAYVGGSTWGGKYINTGLTFEKMPGKECDGQHWNSLISRTKDLNGDGLIDVLHASNTTTYSGRYTTKEVRMSTGSLEPGEMVYLQDDHQFPYVLGGSDNNSTDLGAVRVVDLNADKLPDVMRSFGNGVPDNYWVEEEVYMNTGTRPYFLKTIRQPGGAHIELEYKTSGQYADENGDRVNPNLPILVDTVSKITVDDGLGNITSTDYFYEDGHYYYSNPHDRELAGFGIVTKTDAAGIVTKNYYHQSEHSIQRPELGEFEDHISKKGHVYRSEILDSLGNLMSHTNYKWQVRDLGQNRYFPHLEKTTTTLTSSNE